MKTKTCYHLQSTKNSGFERHVTSEEPGGAGTSLHLLWPRADSSNS
jgi:hypothetical protein